jgi:flagellar biosynthesis/type III secretory pathway chaperone
MQGTIKELLTTIDEETVCYEALNQLLSDEKAAISFSKKERLEEISGVKESLVLKLRQYEKSRRPLVDRLAGVLGHKNLPVTVSQLASLIDAPNGEALMVRADRLRSIIDVVKKKNQQNQVLIQQHLDLIGSSLKLLTQHMVGNSVYQKAGTFESFPGYRSGGGRILRGTV